jgi:hypothetical protein
VQDSSSLILAVASRSKCWKCTEEDGAVGDEVCRGNRVGENVGGTARVGVIACEGVSKLIGASWHDLSIGNSQFVVVRLDVLPQSDATALKRAATVLAEEVVLKYSVSFVPDVAAEAADVASLWQLDSAVRTADSLLPVQLEPIAVRLTIALATVAA